MVPKGLNNMRKNTRLRGKNLIKKSNLIIGCIIFAIFAIGSTRPTNKIKNKTIKIGETIKTSKAEITIKKIKFSYDVLPVDDGEVYILIDTDVKNTQKQQIVPEKLMTVTADFYDDYIYSSIDSAEKISIDPLKTIDVRYLIPIPSDIEKYDCPLIVTFNIDGEIYEYNGTILNEKTTNIGFLGKMIFEPDMTSKCKDLYL